MSFYQLYHPTRIYFVHNILDLAVFLFILNQSIRFFSFMTGLLMHIEFSTKPCLNVLFIPFYF